MLSVLSVLPVLRICLSVWLLVCLPVLSVLPVCLSVCLPVCLPVCPLLSLPGRDRTHLSEGPASASSPRHSLLRCLRCLRRTGRVAGWSVRLFVCVPVSFLAVFRLPLALVTFDGTSQQHSLLRLLRRNRSIVGYLGVGYLGVGYQDVGCGVGWGRTHLNEG